MSFPRYPKYQASGVSELGDVPEHWDVKPLKHFAGIDSCGCYGIDAEEGEHVLPVATTAQIDSDGRFVVPDMPMRGFTPAEIQRYGCGDGDILVVKSSGSATNIISGKAGLVTKDTPPFVFSNFLMRIRPTKGLANPRFIYSLLRSHLTRQRVEQICSTTTYPNLKVSEYTSAPLPLPPVAEQTKIAAFLDRETSKIDGLVGEQRRLIELLKEKRQAVISHAVTKGLNPHAPLKPSGIEWLGEIPAHWRGSALKHLAKAGVKTFTDGDWIESPFITSEGVRLIQTGNVGVGFYKEQGFRFVSDETFQNLHCTEVQPRDVLICRLDGPVGRACLAPDLGVRMITSVDNAILKVAEDIAPEFVVALLSSVPWISWIDALCRVGGGFRLRVSRNQLGDLRVPVPPFEEQLAIARYLESETAKWDALTAEAERGIELLQERRTALISAAVTGQIDVRISTEEMPLR
jgi:type I restriction enzyme S subunit